MKDECPNLEKTQVSMWRVTAALLQRRSGKQLGLYHTRQSTRLTPVTHWPIHTSEPQWHAVTVFQRYRFGNSPPRFQAGSLVHVYSGHQGIHLIRVLTAQGEDVSQAVHSLSIQIHMYPVRPKKRQAVRSPDVYMYSTRKHHFVWSWQGRFRRQQVCQAVHPPVQLSVLAHKPSQGKSDLQTSTVGSLGKLRPMRTCTRLSLPQMLHKNTLVHENSLRPQGHQAPNAREEMAPGGKNSAILTVAALKRRLNVRHLWATRKLGSTCIQVTT